MHRVSQIVGKTVVSAETGDRLGSVSDALIDEGRVVALVIGGGLLAREHVLPFQDVKTLGGDTVLARTGSGMIKPAEWRKSGTEAARSSALRGRPVVTTAGQRLGQMNDLLIDDQTGAVEELEVATGGLRNRHMRLRASSEIRIGADAVVVPEGALEQPGDSDTAPAPVSRSSTDSGT